MILKNPLFQRLFAFTVVTSLYGIIIITFKPFGFMFLAAIIIEFLFFAWLFNWLQFEIYNAKIKDDGIVGDEVKSQWEK